jgi:hypothetical protein
MGELGESDVEVVSEVSQVSEVAKGDFKGEREKQSNGMPTIRKIDLKTR